MYEKLYIMLFNAITDAVRCLQRDDSEEALAILITAQTDAEELYISESGAEENSL